MTKFTKEQLEYLETNVEMCEDRLGINVIRGDIYSYVGGNIHGNISGNVGGIIYGDISGNVGGNVLGDVEGNIEGILWGTVDGVQVGEIRWWQPFSKKRSCSRPGQY